MNDFFGIGDPIIYMKVGVHAGEELADIIQRKQAEIDDAGFAMWGYGGNTCHPRTMVHPFASNDASNSGPIRLVMQEVKSNHFENKGRAKQFSLDKETWELVPAGINVLGSQFALCIRNLVEVDEELSLGATRVAVGPSAERVGSEYLKGQADKACLNITEGGDDRPPVPISLVADLVEPYAVFLR